MSKKLFKETKIKTVLSSIDQAANALRNGMSELKYVSIEKYPCNERLFEAATARLASISDALFDARRALLLLDETEG